ncbi:protein singed wings 2 [Epargyreus clarus]|uniref:protein singed wings 2 n=1 Tax=Epargyreus clarus TaxID=520877 RepID=UPI003C2FFC27
MILNLRVTLLLSVIRAATPGVQLRRTNETVPVLRACSLAEYTSSAFCSLRDHHLMCSRGIAGHWLDGVKYDVTHLSVMEWPGDCLDVGRLQKYYPELRTLDIVNCTDITNFKGHFDETSKIEKIAVHGLTSLWEIPPDVIRRMLELRILDLRGNVLRHLKHTTLTGPERLERVYLSDNKWDCSDGGLDWLAMQQDNSTIRRRIVDYYQLVCHQQLYRGKPLHKVMDIIRMVRQTCPEPCACAMTHVVSDREGAIIPLITVDCANKQLVTPPATLPPSTTTLRLEGNKITTIRSIVQNPQYLKLMHLYLDNNSIQAVKELEGSEWFSTFRVLSLRGNMLKQIPVYAFDKAFQVNNNIMHVFLGHNPWRCDCHFIPRFQGLLLKYKRVIRDLTDIRCSKSDDKKISLVQISKVSLGNVCSKSEVEMPISTINIVNLVLIMLIVIIVGRFLYDWHSFKTTGKLPWISSILP